MAFGSVAYLRHSHRAARHWPPIQRPFARQRVILSRCLKRYYGLICASPFLPPIYALDGRSLPNGRPGEGPHFQLHVSLDVPPSLPRWIGQVRLAVASLLVQAFAVSVAARHPQTRARRFPRGSISRLQSSLNAAARQVARPSPTRTFTLELSPSGVASKNVEYDYAGSQPTPATGLAPATHAASWAAHRNQRTA